MFRPLLGLLCGAQGTVGLRVGALGLRRVCGAPAWCPAQHPGFSASVPALAAHGASNSPLFWCLVLANTLSCRLTPPRQWPLLSSVFPGAFCTLDPRSTPSPPTPRHASSFAQHKNAPLFYCCIQKSVNAPGAPSHPLAVAESPAGGTGAGP